MPHVIAVEPVMRDDLDVVVPDPVVPDGWPEEARHFDPIALEGLEHVVARVEGSLEEEGGLVWATRVAAVVVWVVEGHDGLLRV